MNKTHLKSIAPLGGQAVVKKYGSEYMRELGKRGARATWSKYVLKPVGTNNFALVDRVTGAIKNTLVKVW